MSQKLTILFDLDGTLVDTAPDLMSAHNHVMKKFGFENKSSNNIRKLVGQGANSLITRSVWGKAKKDFTEITDQQIKKEMVDEFLKFYKENIAVGSKLVKGANNFLEWAKKNNISMGICTNKQDYLAIELLKKIKVYDFFEYVAGSNTFDYCKPDPRHLTNVIEIMNGNLQKSLMIGDSEIDASAAKSADIPFILLKDGYTEKKVNEIPHNHLINDFVGLEKIIENYLND